MPKNSYNRRNLEVENLDKKEKKKKQKNEGEVEQEKFDIKGELDPNSYNVVTEEELEVKNYKELIDYLVESTTLERKNKFQLIHNPAPSSIRLTDDLKMEDIHGYYDFSERMQNKYKFPFFDEREFGVYRKRKLGGKKMMPHRGWFWVVGTEMEERPFGLVTVSTYVAMVTIRPSDNRFELVKKLKVEEKNFFYYYQPTKEKNEDDDIVVYQGIYKQVTLDAEDNPYTEEYRRREALLDAAYLKLSRVGETYLSMVSIICEKVFKQKVKNITVVQDFLRFFNRYERDIKRLEPLLPLKIVYSHVDSEQYEYIKNHIEEIKNEVKQIKKELEPLVLLYGETPLNFVDEEIKYQKSMQKIYNKCRKLVKRCRSLFRARPEYKMGEEPDIRGYIGKLEDKLVPSLVTIETGRTFTIRPSNEEKIQELEEKLLLKYNSVNVKELEEEEEELEIMKEKYPLLSGIFNSKELDEIEELIETNEGRTKFKVQLNKKLDEIRKENKELEKEGKKSERKNIKEMKEYLKEVSAND